MKPSDIKYFEECIKKQNSHLIENKKLIFWKRKKFKLDGNGVDIEYQKFLEINELVKKYYFKNSGRRLYGKFGKEKYELLPRIRKRKETISVSVGRRKVYTAKDFPISGKEYGGIKFIKDAHNLSHEQWEQGWLSDENGKMTIMDDGTWVMCEDGFYYDVEGNKKPSKKRKKYEMNHDQLKEYIKKQRSERNKRYYDKKKTSKRVVDDYS